MTGPDPATEQVSVCLGQAGCCCYVFRGFSGRARPCEERVTHAGLVLVESRFPVQLWLAFTCSGHAPRVAAARELLPRDEEERARRERELAAGRAGRTYQRALPIATGADARARFRRATRTGDDQL